MRDSFLIAGGLGGGEVMSQREENKLSKFYGETN